MVDICFPQSTFYTYLFLSLCIIILYVYIISKEECKECKSKTVTPISIINPPIVEENYKNKFNSKIYDPLERPDIIYPGGSFTEPGYNANNKNQQIGFVFNESGRFPIFGKYKYYGRSDRWEYYTIDDSRGRIKIPFETKNNEELYSGDVVKIIELSDLDFTFNKYDIENVKYNPRDLY